MVVVTGARQAGKSTLAREGPPFAARGYVTLDTATNREIAIAEPRVLLGTPQQGLTVDEVQRVPELFFSIKELVDANRVNGRFLLTGSANLLLLNNCRGRRGPPAAFHTSR